MGKFSMYMPVMKKFILYLFVTLVTLLILGCSIFSYKMSAKIVSITQDPGPPLGPAVVEVLVRNTGWGEIDYYTIFVAVTCSDASVYTGSKKGYNLPSDISRTEYVVIDTEEKQVDKGEATDVQYGTF
jgi:hypothetical protein